MKRLIYDTETTGLFPRGMAYDHPDMPRMIQLAAIMVNEDWESVHEVKVLIKPDGFIIPEDAQRIHGITTEYAAKYGINVATAILLLDEQITASDEVYAFNAQYDDHITAGERFRSPLLYSQQAASKCAMLLAMNIMKLPGRYGNYKWPNLQEAHEFFCGSRFDKAHDALADVRATIRVMREMEKRGELK